MKSLRNFILIVFFAFLICPLNGLCSNPWMSDYVFIGTYSGPYSGADPLEIYGILDQDGEYGVAIELYQSITADEHTKFILIKDFELTSFLNTLKNFRDKSAKWTSVALENNVKDYYKKYDIECIDVYGLTTPDSTEGAGLWNSEFRNSSFFVSTTGMFMYELSFWGTCESGDAFGKNTFFELQFYNLNQINELINILNPSYVENKLGIGKGNKNNNYDSLFN